MNRHNLSADELEKWERGEAEARLHKNLDTHASGERGFNVFGVFLLILVGLVLINIPALFRAIVHLF
jgi:hypothetical protein